MGLLRPLAEGSRRERPRGVEFRARIARSTDAITDTLSGFAVTGRMRAGPRRDGTPLSIWWRSARMKWYTTSDSYWAEKFPLASRNPYR